MAKDFNFVQISGNLVADPEMRYTDSGIAVVNFRIASSRPFRDDDDEWDEESTFVSATAWRNTAEMVAELDKGQRVMLAGRLRLNEWETDDGDTRSYLFIEADNVQPLGRWGDFLSDDDDEDDRPRRRNNGRKRNGRKRNGKGGSRRKARSRSRDEDMDVDDIPF